MRLTGQQFSNVLRYTNILGVKTTWGDVATSHAHIKLTIKSGTYKVSTLKDVITVFGRVGLDYVIDPTAKAGGL